MNTPSTVRVSWMIVWLIALWILLWGDLSIANVASGAAVAVGVLTLARLPRLTSADSTALRIRPFALAWFGLYVLYKLVESNLVLAWEIVTPTNKINNGVVAVPLRTSSPSVMMVVANMITLTPGTLTIEVDGDPPVLYVNVLQLHDVERVRRDLLHLEELAVRAFGSTEAREQLDRPTDAAGSTGSTSSTEPPETSTTSSAEPDGGST